MDSFETPWSGAQVAGTAALSLANTLDWRLRATPVELVKSYEDVLRWARTAGALEPREARALLAWGAGHRRSAARLLAGALEVREAIAAVFQAVARGERIPEVPLARLDDACRAAAAARALRREDRGARWTWRHVRAEPERPAWAAALDAARLLTSNDRERVRECADAQCGWLFLDTSRNRSRTWCTMEGCGNRNKARRFYRRAATRRVRRS